MSANVLFADSCFFFVNSAANAYTTANTRVHAQPTSIKAWIPNQQLFSMQKKSEYHKHHNEAIGEFNVHYPTDLKKRKMLQVSEHVTNSAQGTRLVQTASNVVTVHIQHMLYH